MSTDNTGLIVGGLIVAYLVLKKSPGIAARAPVAQPGGVASMPGSVGTGMQQIATGALSGFLGSIMNGPRNATSQTYFASERDPVQRGDVAQEAYYPDETAEFW